MLSAGRRHAATVPLCWGARSSRSTAPPCTLTSSSLRGLESAHDGPPHSPLALGLSTGRLAPTVPHDGAHSVLQHVSVCSPPCNYGARSQHTLGIVHPYYCAPRWRAHLASRLPAHTCSCCVWRPLLAPTEDSHTTYTRCGYLTWPDAMRSHLPDAMCRHVSPYPVLVACAVCAFPPRHAYRGEGGPPLPEGSSAV
jgi:hypothetical protein